MRYAGKSESLELAEAAHGLGCGVALRRDSDLRRGGGCARAELSVLRTALRDWLKATRCDASATGRPKPTVLAGRPCPAASAAGCAERSAPNASLKERCDVSVLSRNGGADARAWQE